MRRTLGTLTLLVVLATAGCGGSASTAHDSSGRSPSETPASPSSSAASPASPSGGPVDYDVVTLLTQTAAGGTVSSTLTPLTSAREVRAFGAQFRMPAMTARIATVVDTVDLPADRQLMGAVVAVGCDVPPGVDVFRQDGGLTIVAQEVVSPLPECLAPVTTVALVSLPRSQ